MTLPPESEWSNLDWLTALRADSDQAWAAIRGRVLRSLRTYLRRRGRTLADDDLEVLAEDAVQETLLTVRAKLDTFRNDSRFTTWVHRIAVNALLGQLRQRRWNVRSPETAITPQGPPEQGPLCSDPTRTPRAPGLFLVICSLVCIRPAPPRVVRVATAPTIRVLISPGVLSISVAVLAWNTASLLGSTSVPLNFSGRGSSLRRSPPTREGGRRAPRVGPAERESAGGAPILAPRVKL